MQDVSARGSLLVVADGMGGAAAGELASQMATDAIFRHLARVWSREPEATPQRFAYRLKEAVEVANQELHAYASAHPEVRGMGTTATAVGLLNDCCFLTQVGDSRAYLVRNGRAVQLTKDQSLMQRLIDAGELTEEEAARNERRNIILQALGPDPHIKVDLTYQELRRGDVLVLCSDGLSGQVASDEIAAVIARAPTLAAAGDELIALANERGGPDNITVVLARVSGAGLRPPDADAAVGHRVYPLGALAAPAAPQPDQRDPAPPGRGVAHRRPALALAAAAAAAAAAAVVYWIIRGR
jgi:protein phosphatase